MTQIRELARTVSAWLDEGHPVALAHVGAVVGFGATSPGEMLAVRGDGATTGSLLRGAVHEPVLAAATELLAVGTTGGLTTVTVPVGEHDAEAAGLACAGRATVLVHDAAQVPGALWRALADGEPAAMAVRVDDDHMRAAALVAGTWLGALGRADDDAAATARAEAMIAAGATSSTELVDDVVVDAWVPVPALVAVGAGVLADALAAQAALLGWTFERVDGVAAAHARIADFAPSDVLVLLDHDPAMDGVLATGLAGGRGFIGALGSRHTQAERRARLAASGTTQEQLGRLHGPVGLDLGARGPAEVAVSIVAEVLATRSGRTPGALREGTGAINRR